MTWPHNISPLCTVDTCCPVSQARTRILFAKAALSFIFKLHKWPNIYVSWLCFTKSYTLLINWSLSSAQLRSAHTTRRQETPIFSYRPSLCIPLFVGCLRLICTESVSFFLFLGPSRWLVRDCRILGTDWSFYPASLPSLSLASCLMASISPRVF